MSNLNRVVLMGRLNDDPTSSATAKGKKMTTFYVATNEFIKNAEGEKIKRTDWHKVITYGKIADACEKLLRKGSMVLVEGKIRNTIDKRQKNPSYEIIASDVSFISNYKAEEHKEAKDGDDNN